MAVARKIKTLLTVNILVFVGIILFSVYCRIQDRSEELIQIGRISDQRLRARNGKVSNLVDRQSILQRLERLEDVVYNQLNGLAKPMGLVEGPGGLGQGGAPATLGEDSRDAEGKYEEYGYNAQLSDRISLDRSIPDYRPKNAVLLSYLDRFTRGTYTIYLLQQEGIAIYHNMIIHLTCTVISEMDGSRCCGGSASVTLHMLPEPQTKLPNHSCSAVTHWHSVPQGAVHLQLKCIATASMGLYHIDFRTRLAEPILTRMKEDHTRIILPAIDNIKYNTFEVQQYANAAHGYNWGLWCMYIIPPQEWLDKGRGVTCLEIKKDELQTSSKKRSCARWILDLCFQFNGFTPVSLCVLPVQVWQCGGSMEVLPCARVAHIERTKKPYNNDIDYYAKRNALRAAEVWMDEYKSHVYMAWNIPMNVRNSKASGYCLDQGAEDDDKAILYPCHGMSSQLARYSTEGLLQLGPLGSTTFLPDTKCLVDDGRGRTPRLKKCEAVSRNSQRLWDFTQNGPIISRDTGRCLEVEMSKDANFGLRLVVQRCSGQKWMIRNWVKHPRH
ncbi:unnamed protein product, partial [Tetraodon nigroviridis]